MLVTHKAREYFFQYPFLETVIILTGYIVVGYLINPQDMLMFEQEFSFLTLLLAIITLFHGIVNGMVAMLILAVVMSIGYKDAHYFLFLKELVLVLIYGEFHYYWTGTIKKHAAQDSFTRQKLSELSRSFYMLKLSHDQIEKSYVTKPMSLRNSIYSIKESYGNKTTHSEFYQGFLVLLEKTLKIDSAILIKTDESKKVPVFTVLAQSYNDTQFDTKDLLVRSAYEKQVPLYVSSDEKYSNSKYLAVIPSVTAGKVVGMLVVEKMPFMSFNRDNLISATILLSYLFDETQKMEIMKEMGGFLPCFQQNFRFEAYRMFRMNQKYDAESTLLIFKSGDKLLTHMLKDAVMENLRSMDIMSSIEKNDEDAIAILFMLADRESVRGFVNRIFEKIPMVDKASLHYSSFSIRDIELAEQFVTKKQFLVSNSQSAEFTKSIS